MAERGLLAHVVSKFAPSQWENVASEALLYVLRRDGYSAALERVLQPTGVSLRGCRWRGQVTAAEDQSRPDLVALDAQDRSRLILEAKFWALLTPNQPHGYLERQAREFDGERDRRLLLFVAPETRVEPLAARLAAMLGSGVARHNGLAVIEADAGNVAVLSWGRLLDGLEEAAGRLEDSDGAEALRQLRGLCTVNDRLEMLPLTSDDVDAVHARRHLRLVSTAFAVADRLKSDGLVTVPGSDSSSKDWVGRRLQSWHGATFLMLFSSYRWANDYPTPFWLSFPKPAPEVRQALSRLEGEAVPKVVDAGSRVLVALETPLGVEHDEVVTRLAANVAAVLRAVPAGSASSSDPLDETVT
ncbi:MAG: hypothetical protein LCI03_04075 [Actinobacteria bacterium]|nr:hypothetical protein [Actinomycetota bacterium]